MEEKIQKRTLESVRNEILRALENSKKAYNEASILFYETKKKLNEANAYSENAMMIIKTAMHPQYLKWK